jgi:peptidoglycan/LPS O-acetylase OafA/YrhL
MGAAMLLIALLLTAGAVFELADFQDNALSATTIYGISGLFAIFGVGLSLGAMLLGTSIVSLRTGVFPRWLAWPAAVVGVALVLAWSFWPVTAIGGILALALVLITSILAINKTGKAAA